MSAIVSPSGAMLHLFSKLKTFRVLGPHGQIGRASDFYFDDEEWAIEYLSGRISAGFGTTPLLISVYFLDAVEPEQQAISLLLSLVQIRRSGPASFSIAPALQNAAFWATASNRSPGAGHARLAVSNSGTAHLHSCVHIAGHYLLHGRNGKIGLVEDFLIGTDEWSLRYLVIRLDDLFPGKLVLLPTNDVCRISHERAEVIVDFCDLLVAEAPEFVAGNPVKANYEQQVRRHYQEHRRRAESRITHAPL